MINFRQGMQPGGISTMTPRNDEGLRMPNGQAVFNLPRMPPAPGTNVNFPTNVPMGGGSFGMPNLKMSITRTASSDPVQNIINDIQNPLNSTNVNFEPAQAPANSPQSGGISMRQNPNQGGQPFPSAMSNIGFGNPSAMSDIGFGSPRSALADIGGLDSFLRQQPPGGQFGLRGRMTRAAMGSGGMQPFTFL